MHFNEEDEMRIVAVYLGLVVAMAVAVIAGAAHGATNELKSLNDGIGQGSITIESVAGTGRSSGMALNAVLTNTTEMTQRIFVYLDAPLYFRNRNSAAQDMVATQVYARDGMYWRQSDHTPFIEVAAWSRLPVTFVAYCADFDKDNPSGADALDIVPVRQSIATVMRQISAYEAANQDVDTVPIRLGQTPTICRVLPRAGI